MFFLKILRPLIILFLVSSCGMQDFILINGWPDRISPVNFKERSPVHSGFLIGSVSIPVTQVKVRFDGGDWVIATGTQLWKVKLPCMQDTGKQWKMGENHQVQVQAFYQQRLVAVNSWWVTQGINRDINGDGYGDIASGSWFYNGGVGNGAVYLFYSRGQNGILTQTAASADSTLTGNAAADFFGYDVALGDVNGDGYADVVIGANGNGGSVFIFHSQGSNGVSSQTAATADTTLTGEGLLDAFGQTVAAGDINGDGYCDVIVAAKTYNAGFSEGRVYIFHSLGSSGISTQNAGSANTTLTGNANNDQLGTALAVGDINGDGYGDVLASAENAGGQGEAYIFLSQGSAGISTQSVVTANTILTSPPAGSGFGRTVATGDFTSDGYDDVAVASFTDGKVYIFHSRGSNGVESRDGDSASSILTSESGGAGFGGSIATGDINGDGITDISIGDFAYNGGIGRAYIFYSSRDTGVTTQGAESANTKIDGKLNGDFFAYALAISDINGDSYGDLLSGGWGYPGGMFNGGVFVFHSLGNSGIATQTITEASTTLAGISSNDYNGYTID